MKKKAIITGIAGQDGSYLAELLLEKGYEVHGIEVSMAEAEKPVRLGNILHLLDKVHLHFGLLESGQGVDELIGQLQPDECYHLGAASFVSFDFEGEAGILQNNVGSTHALLAALKRSAPHCRFFFAGTSEMFGTVDSSPQNEMTPLHPRSVYGISKVTGQHLVDYYRQHHGLFACTGILYNHESPRRGMAFVTRKITATAAKIKLGLESKLYLGNLDAFRDWGYAPDYVRAMWMMLQLATPEDFVLASGETHSVREFVEKAFAAVGLDYRDYVEVDPRFFREAEKVVLCGDIAKARRVLGWSPGKAFADLVDEMVQNDLQQI